jgi:riboflavin transporter FmnP
MIVGIITFTLNNFNNYENKLILQLSIYASIFNVICILLLNYFNRLGLYRLMAEFKSIKIHMTLNMEA